LMSERKLQTNPVKVIREKCLECCCWQPEEVRKCTATGCPLHPFRMGKNPYRAKSSSPAQRAAWMKNLQKAAAAQEEIKDNPEG
jgi:hypothetical protein